MSALVLHWVAFLLRTVTPSPSTTDVNPGNALPGESPGFGLMAVIVIFIAVVLILAVGGRGGNGGARR